MSFPERDWRHLSRLKPLALERLCLRILNGARERIAAVPEGEAHRVYLDLYRYIQEQDELIAEGFDDWRRSRAFSLLTFWRACNLITDEEFSGFSADTREAVETSLALWEGGNDEA